MDTVNKLEDLKKADLVALITRIYGLDAVVDQYIEQAVVKTDSGLKKQLLSKVSAIKRSRKFIHYNESFAFANTLLPLVDGLQTLFEQNSPKDTFEVADKFLQSANSVFARIDDSSGSVSDVYRDIVVLWIRAAEGLRESGASKINWVDKALSYFDDNDYGIYDSLLPQCGNLLTKDELLQLAWRFEAIAEKALKEKGEEYYNSEASQARIGLRSVAEALRDPELYERATLIISPQPNELQKEQLAAYCLELELPERALGWLQGQWSERFRNKQVELLEASYRQLGEEESIRKLREEQYLRQPSWYTLEPLLEMADPQERERLIHEARQQAPELQSLDAAVTLLLMLEELPLAAETLLQRHEELSQTYYPTLTEWAKQLSDSQALAAVLCVRALLEDILTEGRSKAYRYAARYFKKLLTLDAAVSDYRQFPNAREYITSLQQQHGRKRSFWELAGHPNKPGS